MTFTRNVKDTVLARINAEPELKEVLKEEGINAYLQGDIDTGKAKEVHKTTLQALITN
jgi:hypothetical protein